MKDKRPDRAPDREALEGVVERVTFHSPDSGFCVLRVKVRGHRELVTVIGATPLVQPGEYIHSSGRWIHHREHGLQFHADFLQTTPPNSLDGMEKYLSRGLIKGIGPYFARKLVKAYGEEVFEVIEKEPDRLREVEGIGPKRARRIASGWDDQKAVREIMVFLQSHGVGTARAVRIYKTYGAEAIPRVTENPYRLARDIRGIGFRTADQIAEKLGVSRTSMMRARAGIAFTLTEAITEGHCGLPEESLLTKAETLLEIPRETLSDALSQELQDGAVAGDTIAGNRCIFLAFLWYAERQIADRIRSLSVGKPSCPDIDASKAMPWVEKKLGVALADSQREAVHLAVVSKVMVITGGPGVGKTTLVNTYRPGDKVMQTDNDYDKEVFNGDIGTIESVDADAQEVMIFFDSRLVKDRLKTFV